MKDSERFAERSGWGWAAFKYDAASDRFTPVTLGGQRPQGKDAKCGLACHTIVKTREITFSQTTVLNPKVAQVLAEISGLRAGVTSEGYILARNLNHDWSTAECEDDAETNLSEEFAMYRRGEASRVEPGVREALARPPRAFDEFVRDYAPLFV